MTTAPLAYPDWKAPAQDGELLIWPDPHLLREQTRANQRLLTQASVHIQRIPLPELRAAQRRWIGHTDDDRPLIATGHQIELHHPGVWAKDVLACQLAQRLDGSAYHFAVDTDAPKHLRLRWPGAAFPVTDDPRLGRAAWAELLAAPTPAHLAEVQSSFAADAAAWNFSALLADWLSALRRLSFESDSLTSVLINSIHQLNWDLGLRHHALAVSPLWSSPAYLVFAHDLLARAEAFAEEYNTVLDEYRREQSIDDPGRPWPNLRRDEKQGRELFSSLEVPFWLDDLATGQRSRASVQLTPDGWALAAGADRLFPLDPSADGWEAAGRLAAFLTASALRLSPRAMTLTIFLRLCVADQFIHGIGGGRYDQITDRVIARCYFLPPPAFCVTTATLYFPTALSQRRADVPALAREGRRLRHGWDDPRKRQMAREIASLPRNTAERRRRFYEMHQHLANQIRTDRYRDWENRLVQERDLAQRQHELFDRELFFALQPPERLQSIIARYHGLVSS